MGSFGSYKLLFRDIFTRIRECCCYKLVLAGVDESIHEAALKDRGRPVVISQLLQVLTANMHRFAIHVLRKYLA